MFHERILDILFPPREEELQVRVLKREEVLGCYEPHFVTPTTTALSHYDHPIVQSLIREAKFHYNRRAHAWLGTLVLYHHATMASSVRYVPIPLSAARQRERGYNQVEAVLQAARLPYFPLLSRVRHTPPQTSLGRTERLKNLTNAFGINERMARTVPMATPLILVDDVTTTGATLQAAEQSLRAAGYHDVRCLTLAH